jgi:hypothetical protein
MMILRSVIVMITAVAALSLAACGDDSTSSPSDTQSPAVTATASPTTSTGWSCSRIGLYDFSFCRLPDEALALVEVGDAVVATEEESYPTCPESWTANDAGQLCVPPSDWQADVQSGAATLSSSNGAQVRIGPDPFNVFAEKCDPVYFYGIILGGSTTAAEWCINLGDRYADIAVPAGLPAPDYYEAFQVALSAGGQ